MSRRIVQLVSVVCLLASGVWAGTDPLVGKWKLNPSQSRFVDVMKVESLGGNKYTFNFEGGGPETVVADGSEHPGVLGTLLSVKITGPRTLTVVRKKDGRKMLSADWTLSEDGKTLHDSFTQFQPDGSPSTDELVYQRTAGTVGFAGTWENTTQQMPALELEVSPFESDGLSFAIPPGGTAKSLRFDGQEYPNPGVAPGFTCSGQRLSASSLKLTNKRDEKLVDTREVELSQDGKVLTMTVHPVGQAKPHLLVFERE